MAAGDHLHRLADRLLPRHAINADGNGDIGTDAGAHVIRLQIETLIHGRRLPQPDDDFGAGHRQALAGADVEGDAAPAPGIDLQLQGGKGFHLGIGGHSLLLPVAAKLPAHQVLRLQRRNGFQHLDLFVARRFAVGADRRLHGQVDQDLEQVVLDHVADGAGLIIKGAPALDAEIFRHGDLHAFDMIAVPERLQNGIGEAEEDHVMNRLLPQVMIDAENRFLVESREQDAIERQCRNEVVSERFFDDDAGGVGAVGLGELLHNQAEEHGRDGEVVGRPLSGTELLADGLKGSRILVIPVHVMEQAAQLVESGGIESAVLFKTVLGAGPELVELPAGLGHADDRHLEMAALQHRLQGWKNLLVGQISGGPKENQGIGMGHAHQALPLRQVSFHFISQGAPPVKRKPAPRGKYLHN